MTITSQECVVELISEGPEETKRLGEWLGTKLRAGDVVALSGELGTGKTCLVQGIALGLGIPHQVHSPTFILANEYNGGRLPLYHIDVYRVESVAEAQGFGLDDYVNGDGVTVIEWAERILAGLPPEYLWIELSHLGENRRGLAVVARGEHYSEIVRELESWRRA